MFKHVSNINAKKTNFNKTTLILTINISLSLLTIFFIFQYIWMGFFVSVSLKNYLSYFLWNFVSIFYSTILDTEVFGALDLNFGYMILLNDHPIYWSIELQWMVEQFLINPSKSIMYDSNQLEILILHLLNNFFIKLEYFFSFGILFLIIGFFHLIASFPVNKNLTYKKFFFKKEILIEKTRQLIFIKILVDFLFFLLTPILVIYFIFFYFKKIWFYIYLVNLSFNKIILTHKWPNFFLIVSGTNINLLTSEDILFIKEKIKAKYFNELRYYYNNILVKSWGVFKYFFLKKNELIGNIINGYSDKISLNFISRLHLIFFLIKSYVFYFTKLFNYLIILINLSFRFKLINFCVVNNQFFFTLKKANNLVISKVLLWKPLFKRWSYYGFFSKTRTYWSRFSHFNEIKFIKNKNI